MILNELLKPDNVLCDATDIVSKKQVLEHIGDIVCKQSDTCNYVEVLQALIQRERLGSTALGHGVAVPHARVADLEQPIVCLITLHTAINFYEDEKTAVDIIFGILVPLEANETQLEILSTIATRLQNKSYRERLRQAKTDEQLYQAAISQPVDQGAPRAKEDTDDQK